MLPILIMIDHKHRNSLSSPHAVPFHVPEIMCMLDTLCLDDSGPQRALSSMVAHDTIIAVAPKPDPIRLPLVPRNLQLRDRKMGLIASHEST